MKQILLQPKRAEKMTKWAIDLGEHDITYKPRIGIKGKALADFLTEILDDSQSSLMTTLKGTVERQEMPAIIVKETWMLHVHGESRKD